MKLKNKYIKCFTKDKYEELLSYGYTFLHEQRGVYYFENDDDTIETFSSNKILKGTKTSNFIGI